MLNNIIKPIFLGALLIIAGFVFAQIFEVPLVAWRIRQFEAGSIDQATESLSTDVIYFSIHIAWMLITLLASAFLTQNITIEKYRMNNLFIVVLLGTALFYASFLQDLLVTWLGVLISLAMAGIVIFISLTKFSKQTS